jgi:hypothetical protein
MEEMLKCMWRYNRLVSNARGNARATRPIIFERVLLTKIYDNKLYVYNIYKYTYFGI